jgi:hypothetical protein
MKSIANSPTLKLATSSEAVIFATAWLSEVRLMRHFSHYRPNSLGESLVGNLPLASTKPG